MLNNNGKILILIIVAILIFLVAMGIGYRLFTQNEPEKENTSQVLNEDENKAEDIEEPEEDEKSWSWIVEPNLDYKNITYFYNAGVFYETSDWSTNEDYKIIDTETGKKTNENIPAMSDGYTILAYNKATDKYGKYEDFFGWLEFNENTFSEARKSFVKNWENESAAPKVVPVICVNTKAEPTLDMTNGEDVKVIDLSIAIEESKPKFAYSKEDKLITDFIYTDFDANIGVTTPAVAHNNKWGFINENGEQIIPYEFDKAISIDNERAFVKLDGKWGIIKK